MATTLKRLGQAPTPAVAASATVYTVPSSTKAQITKIILTGKTSSGTCRVKVYDVKNAASAGDQVNLIGYLDLSTTAARVEFAVGAIMDTAGDTIQIATEQVSAGTVDDGAITVYGIEQT